MHVFFGLVGVARGRRPPLVYSGRARIRQLNRLDHLDDGLFVVVALGGDDDDQNDTVRALDDAGNLSDGSATAVPFDELERYLLAVDREFANLAALFVRLGTHAASLLLLEAAKD